MSLDPPPGTAPRQQVADSLFFEVTRSLSPECRVIDAQVLLRDGPVCMRKRGPEHGPFEALHAASAWLLEGRLRA